MGGGGGCQGRPMTATGIAAHLRENNVSEVVHTCQICSRFYNHLVNIPKVWSGGNVGV